MVDVRNPCTNVKTQSYTTSKRAASIHCGSPRIKNRQRMILWQAICLHKLGMISELLHVIIGIPPIKS